MGTRIGTRTLNNFIFGSKSAYLIDQPEHADEPKLWTLGWALPLLAASSIIIIIIIIIMVISADHGREDTWIKLEQCYRKAR
jgi:hypothetical protein